MKMSPWHSAAIKKEKHTLEIPEKRTENKQRMSLCPCTSPRFSYILKSVCSSAPSTESRKGNEEARLSGLDISVQRTG